ncbi:MAG TPA: hypothetical protein VJR94_06760 [Candidatus Nitrosocosmicus sp.]|nr:hypothetical protein [Candidatus Nitrosocosmicus sp.]
MKLTGLIGKIRVAMSSLPCIAAFSWTRGIKLSVVGVAVKTLITLRL